MNKTAITIAVLVTVVWGLCYVLVNRCTIVASTHGIRIQDESDYGTRVACDIARGGKAGGANSEKRGKAMSNGWSKIVTGVIVLAIVAGAIWYIASKRRAAAKQEAEEAAANARMAEEISSLAAKHSAVRDWRDALPDAWSERIYTAQLQDVFVRTDGMPILLLAEPVDVVRRGDGYTLVFWDSLEGVPFGDDLRFELRASTEQAKKVLEQLCESLFFERYAVVAHIRKVRKAAFSVSSDTERPGVECVVDAGDVFFAQGECLDLLFIGDYGTDWMYEGNE